MKGGGAGIRTHVQVEQRPEPFIASRSEGAILCDMVESPGEITRSREQRLLLEDTQDTVSGIDPTLRSIIPEQGNWNLDRLEEQIGDLLRDGMSSAALYSSLLDFELS